MDWGGFRRAWKRGRGGEGLKVYRKGEEKGNGNWSGMLLFSLFLFLFVLFLTWAKQGDGTVLENVPRVRKNC